MTDEHPQFTSFREFWPYYVGEHRKPLCRGLHYAGTGAALVVLGWGIVTRDWWSLLLAPILGYGLSWFAHVAIERNRPATWGWARWSLMADFKMLLLALTGRMRREVERLERLERRPAAPRHASR